ncbi:MAG: hypothetical protein PVH18_00530 [Chloroflexota bacterium]|jgi:hypothetical protein
MSIRTYFAAVLLGLGLIAAACAVEEEASLKEELPPGVTTTAAGPATIEAERGQATGEEPETPGAQPAATWEPTASPAVVLADLGPAPEIHNEVWLNTDQPLSLAALRGQVVLVEFWTFG